VIVTCDFERNKVEVMATIDSAGEIAACRPPSGATAATIRLRITQTPAFTEREVTVGSGEWALPGTLTKPVGAGTVSGGRAGAWIRTERSRRDIRPNKTFKDLALGLGIARGRGAALRQAHQGVRSQGSKLNPFTLKARRSTTRWAVALLRKGRASMPAHLRARPQSWRHGGARIGAADSGIAGLIMLAARVRSLEQSIVDQMQYLADADGVISDAEKRRRRLVAAQRLRQQAHGADMTSSATIGGAPASYWLDLQGYDPAALAATLKQRLLVLQGARDYQVTVADSNAGRPRSPSTRPRSSGCIPPSSSLPARPGQEPATREHRAGDTFGGSHDDIAAWAKKK
jgi:hypothetical protein